MADRMRAATWPAGADAMEIIEAPVPVPGKGEVLVRVHTAGINEMDVETRAGGWTREVKQFRKAGPVVTGFEFAGIAETGSGHIKPGARVYGYSPVIKGPRVHAEYACVPAKDMAEMPDSMSFGEAAALCVMGLTAVEVIDDIAKVKAGDHVCIIGAAGGLGAYATQLAKARSAHVTAVASPANHDFVVAQGADEVRARGETTPLQPQDRFSLILDCPAIMSFAQTKRHLAPGGTYVSSNPMNDLTGFLRALPSRRKAGWLLMLTTTPAKLDRLSRIAGEGHMRPVIDSAFPLDEINSAFDRFATPGKQGRVLIEMD